MDERPDLENDLYHCSWMPRRVEHDDYAQLLYAALCNNKFQKQEVWPVLKGDTWSCTWRSAGTIVSELRGQGNYMDWYLSGNEGVVVDIIAEDLEKLGWQVVTNK